MIPVCVPLLGDKELQYVIDCIRTNWISSSGKYVTQFEEEFAEYCGCKYGITTTSGTTAIHLALASIDLQKDDEVIVPAFTMVSSVLPIIYCGAKPVLVDADPTTGNIDTDLIESKITKKTKAILPVHLYGNPCNMDKISKIAREHRLLVVEDAAESHGATYAGRKTGGIGHIGCFSFYANKIITCGEGGMVVTNDPELAERARSLRNLSFPKGKRIYSHEKTGFNYRMTNLQAALGLAQFERIEELINKRKSNSKIYDDMLHDTPGLRFLKEEKLSDAVCWMYTLLVEESFGLSRDTVIEKLEEAGIESRSFFIPMHQQPVFTNMSLFKGEAFPVAEDLSKKGLYLPSSSGLTYDEIKSICDTLTGLRKA